MPPRKKVVDPNAIPVQPKQRAKREKKTSKHQVVAVITPDGIQGNFQPDIRRPLIAHLPIHSSDVEFHEQHLTYDPRPPCQPEAFNAAEIDPFSSEATYENVPKTVVEEVKEHEAKEVVTPIPVVGKRKEYGKGPLLVCYAESSNTKELPSETSIACFWCCEQFSGRPCIIPSHIIGDVWHVYGNFCTPQCSMAYLIREQLDTHTRWERISLLNRLYSTFSHGRIYPAPARESMERFGGTISSDEFRSICEGQRVRVDLHIPPMVSILASIDTKPIDFYETPLCTTFSTAPQKALTTSDEPKILKLRRTKPLKDKESTLDACLQINIGSTV
uniref:MYM-type domain-containing protein n=1 Tax=viral metagenome TaxID=1070528 RepID=A0A6C0HG69_9ZZZZ